MTQLDKKYIALKLAEECGELSSVLIQYFCFNRKSEAKVVGEIGDVLAWIDTLREQLENDFVDKAKAEKTKVIKGFESGKIPVTFNDPR
jgi:NTP pyrophosphatase (non-canonical NTP hydrolase)